MAQIDELRAALDVIGEKVDEVDTKLDGVRASITGVDQEVRDLIDMLGQPAPDLTEAIAKAQAISTRLGAVSDEVQQASDALGAIPPKPE